MKKIFFIVLLGLLLIGSIVKANAENVTLFGEITKESALRLIGDLKSADLSKDNVIDLYIDSLGGSVLYSCIVAEFMQTTAHPIRVTVFGTCMSGAVIIASAGDKGMRYCHESSQFLVHKAYCPAGQAPDLDSDELHAMLDEYLKLDVILFNKLYKLLNCKKSTLIQQIQDATVFDAKRAKELGIIDHIIGEKE